MKFPRMSIAFFQIFTAVGLLVGYQPSWSSKLIFNPIVSYSLFLALGVAQCLPDTPERRPKAAKPFVKNFTMADLIVYSSFVAIVIADVMLPFVSDSWILENCNFIVLPSSLSIWLQWRYRISLVTGTFVNYAVSVCWAFCFGYMRSPYYNNYLYISESKKKLPLREGLSVATEMLEIGVLTSSWYLIATTLAIASLRYFQRRIRSRPAREVKAVN